MYYYAESRQAKVLITDFAWKSLDVERDILKRVGAILIVAKTGNEDELAALAVDVDGILTCWRHVTEKVIRSASRCRVIGRYGIGLDNIDVQFATRMGIVVTNVPTYCVEEVSDHAMALLLSLARKITIYDRAIKGGVYDLQAGTPLYRLKGKTLGIVGFGNIGRALYRKARSFDLKILVNDPRVDVNLFKEYEAEQVSFFDLLRKSDFISIHAPMTSETRGMLNFEAFRRMKPTAYLINTARGELIDEPGLLRALQEGFLAGAALDVLVEEPPNPEDPLVLDPRIIVTPHAGFNSEESLTELQNTAAAQAADVLSGKRPEFIVNPEVLGQTNLRARFERIDQRGTLRSL